MSSVTSPLNQVRWDLSTSVMPT